MRINIFALMLFLVLGLLANIMVTFACSIWIDIDTGRQSAAEKFVNEEQWLVTRYDKAGAVRIKSTRARGSNWSPQQAAGQPDTVSMGDQVTAWASKGVDTGMEWLILDYANAVIPKAVHVYENYCPGALFKVTLFDENGDEHVAWQGADPATNSTVNLQGNFPSWARPPMTSVSVPRTGTMPITGAVPVAQVPVSASFKTRRVKIYLDSAVVPGWNEIDAVALIDDKGQTQWARRVEASSTYASVSSGVSGGNPELLAPPWSKLATATPAFANAASNREERTVDARGWPFLTLYSDEDLMTQPAGPPVATGSNLTNLGSGAALPLSFSGRTGTIAVSGNAPAPMPTRPIWFGLIANKVIYATFLWICWAAMIKPRRFFRECGRVRNGCCKECGYDLGYDFIHGCPECGWRKERAAVEGRLTMVEQGTNGNGN
jgi:hypothetical protein